MLLENHAVSYCIGYAVMRVVPTL